MFEVWVIYKSMKCIDFLEKLLKTIMLELYWTECMGAVPQYFWSLRYIADASNNCWMNIFMDRVSIGIIEACRDQRVFYIGVDDATVCHCDECSTRVCGNDSSSKVFSFLNDNWIWSRLLAPFPLIPTFVYFWHIKFFCKFKCDIYIASFLQLKCNTYNYHFDF